MITPIVYILAFLFTLSATVLTFAAYDKIRNKELLWLVLTFGTATLLRAAHVINYFYKLEIAGTIAGFFIIVWLFGLLGARGLYRTIKEMSGQKKKVSRQYKGFT